MPMSLMPLADFEKCNVPIYARRNCKEVIGKKDDFKINTGYMGRKVSRFTADLKKLLVYVVVVILVYYFFTLMD